jgi:hypothetical protein
LNAKPIVFISHIVEEAEVAAAFKSLIENAFLGLIDVFVSSDAKSIDLGQRWLDEITNALKHCAIEFVFCSPISIQRPWINFEAGAGWVRGIPVVPLCHSGIQPARLPLPLNLLQAANLSEISSLRHVFTSLSSVLTSNVPNVDFTDFVTTAKEFEARYTFWNRVNFEFKFLKQFLGDYFNVLLSGKVELDMTESQVNLVRERCNCLIYEGVITVDQTGGSQQTPSGLFYGYTVSLTDRGKTVVNDAHFLK